jgi:hypothetical protein
MCIPVEELQYNIFDIKSHIPVICISCNSGQKEYPQPNLLCNVGNGRPMFCIWVMAWSDDVSGNQSKQYNMHTNTCIVNLNIPHHISAQEFFVQFCSTSQYALSSEQVAALVEDL